jgi:hypothetical protein
MYLGSLFTSGLILAVLIPSVVSAEEVTPLRSPAKPNRVVISDTSTYWLGFAVSPNQRAFKSVPLQSESGARNIARNECETTTQRTCNVIAVTENADVSAVECRHNGKSGAFVGGSMLNQQNQIALDKASVEGFPESSCVEFYTY